ncbi:GDSL lipase/esterase [Hysterangium stoloniferum]|nr:GDSL lipase/esterase [Hysterangium stoloniferum]
MLVFSLVTFMLATNIGIGNAIISPIVVQISGVLATTRGRIVAFGDSMTDNGAAWMLSNHTWPQDPAYFDHHFTNGPVWVEHLAQKLGMELIDLAVGGATSNNSVVKGVTGRTDNIPVPSAVDQLASFLKSHTVDPEDLYVIMVGANDILIGYTIEGVVPAIKYIITNLHKNGATKFIVASYSNLGYLPFHAYSSPSTTYKLGKLSTDLQASLKSLRYTLCRGSGINVGFMDVFALFENMLGDPVDYGFDADTVGESCLVGAYLEAPRTLCPDPDRYIFWDEYHPTRVVHRYMGSLAWKASQLMCGYYLRNATATAT